MATVHVVLLISALVTINAVNAQQKDYTGHQLFSIKATTRGQLDVLHSLETNTTFDEIDFWTELSTRRSIDVRVSPSDVGKLRSYLQDHGIDYSVAHNNLEDLVAGERDQMARMKKNRAGTCDPMTTYCTFDEGVAYINSLASQYPNNIEVHSIGTTYEGRIIYNVKVAEDLNSAGVKPSIWVEAGTHPREWVAISSGLNLIQKLLDGSDTSKQMLAAYTWNIVPMHNPDGYQYSHTSVRYQRKNRQPPSNRPCNRNNGIDLNRNWDAAHGTASTSSICSEDLFGGDGPFEALETIALRDAVMNDVNNVFAFFSIHCYSELMLVPYAYTSTKPTRYTELFNVAENMMAWLETVRGTYYITGTPPDILYEASGGAYDYFYLQGIPYAYTYELSPGSGAGLAGFNIDPSFIAPISEEVYRSLWAFVNLNLTWP